MKKVPPSTKCPFKILSLPTTATKVEVELRWRRLASIHHPDKGGDKDEFHKYHQATLKALSKIKPSFCLACNGSGRVSVKGLKLHCSMCGGTGGFDV